MSGSAQISRDNKLYDIDPWMCPLTLDFFGEHPVSGNACSHVYSGEGLCRVIAARILEDDANRFVDLPCSICNTAIETITIDQEMLSSQAARQDELHTPGTEGYIRSSLSREGTPDETYVKVKYTLLKGNQSFESHIDTRKADERPSLCGTYRVALEQWKEDQEETSDVQSISSSFSTVHRGSMYISLSVDDWKKEMHDPLTEKLVQEIKDHQSLTVTKACEIRDEMIQQRESSEESSVVAPVVTMEDPPGESGIVVVHVPVPSTEEGDSQNISVSVPRGIMGYLGDENVIQTAVFVALSIAVFIFSYINNLLPFIGSKNGKRMQPRAMTRLLPGPISVY